MTHSEIHSSPEEATNRQFKPCRIWADFLKLFVCSPPKRSLTSWSIVRRGELMFSSAPRENNAHRHMKTSDVTGPKSAARSRQKTTSRTWGPIGGERLKRDLCFVNFLTTKRWAGFVFTQDCLCVGGRGTAAQAILHVAPVFVEAVQPCACCGRITHFALPRKWHATGVGHSTLLEF